MYNNDRRKDFKERTDCKSARARKFFGKNSQTGKYTETAPSYVNKQLQNKDFKQAVDKGLRILGE
jgi:hypothetical protein